MRRKENQWIELEEVIQAYYECRKNKRNSKSQLRFEVVRMEDLNDLWEELNDRTYQIGKSIAFVVTRPKHREVFAADFRDRIVHHIIMHRLEPLFESVFIDDNYNCRKNKGVLYGVSRLAQKIKAMTHDYTTPCYITKCDIQGFFMHIDKRILVDKLKQFIFERYEGNDISELMWLVELVVMNCPENNCDIRGDRKLWDFIPDEKSLFTNGDNLGLPIGNLTSQMFANFYLHEFDIKMQEITGENYGRYVDDFYILTPDNTGKRLLPMIREELSKIGLTLHPRKIYNQDYVKGVKFIGSVVKNGRIYSGNQTIANLEDAIFDYNNMIEDAKNEEEARVVTNKFINAINSYFGFLKHTNSFAIKRKYYKTVSSKLTQKMYADKHFSKVCLFNKYKDKNILLNQIKSKRHGTSIQKKRGIHPVQERRG